MKLLIIYLSFLPLVAFEAQSNESDNIHSIDYKNICKFEFTPKALTSKKSNETAFALQVVTSVGFSGSFNESCKDRPNTPRQGDINKLLTEGDELIENDQTDRSKMAEEVANWSQRYNSGTTEERIVAEQEYEDIYKQLIVKDSKLTDSKRKELIIYFTNLDSEKNRPLESSWEIPLNGFRFDLDATVSTDTDIQVDTPIQASLGYLAGKMIVGDTNTYQYKGLVGVFYESDQEFENNILSIGGDGSFAYLSDYGLLIEALAGVNYVYRDSTEIRAETIDKSDDYYLRLRAETTIEYPFRIKSERLAVQHSYKYAVETDAPREVKDKGFDRYHTITYSLYHYRSGVRLSYVTGRGSPINANDEAQYVLGWSMAY